jgi:hypothetical protein
VLRHRDAVPAQKQSMVAHQLRRALFASALALLAAGLMLCAAASASRTIIDKEDPGTWCGGTLWRLMTLSDDGRQLVDLQATPTTIAEIAKLEAPTRITPVRATNFQRQSWSLRAVIDRYRIASNGEIVLILYSIDTAQFMNVYLPNPHCLGPRARDRADMIAARKALTSRCPTVTPAWQLLGVTVEVTGIGFWNPSRATRGALQNGAELRPLTGFKIVTGCGIW